MKENNYTTTLGASTYAMKATREIIRAHDGCVYAVESDVAYFRDLCTLRIYHETLNDESVTRIEEMMWHPSANTLINNQLVWPILTLKNEQSEVIGYLASTIEREPLYWRALFTPRRPAQIAGWTRLTLCRVARRWIEQCIYLERACLSLMHASKGELYLSTEEPGVVYTLCALIEGSDIEAKSEHTHTERQAVSERLFELLMLGRGPRLSAGAGLPYDYAERPESTDDTEALSCWRALSVPLRALAERTFERGESVSLQEWAEALDEYARRLEEGVYPLGLTGEIVTLHKAPVRIDDGRKRGTGDPLNLITHGPLYERFGLIELSTRAVKYMSADLGRLWEGWSWDAFKNRASLTSTGQLLSAQDHTLHLERFKRRVLPHIKDAKRFLLEKEVNRIYVIATAVYRSAENREEILALIQKETGLSVQILDRNQEAHETFYAYQWIEGSLPRDTLMIDQGGGSTELSYFDQEGILLERAHITLGTEAALNVLLASALPSAALTTALTETRRLLRERVNEATRALRQMITLRERPFDIVGLGSAITKATGRSKNAAQHGVTLGAEQLSAFINKRLATIERSGLNTLGALHHHIHEQLSGQTPSETHEALIHILGADIFQLMLTRFGVTELRVSGVGLRYGFLRSRLVEAIRSDYGVTFGEGPSLFAPPEDAPQEHTHPDDSSDDTPSPPRAHTTNHKSKKKHQREGLDLSTLGVNQGDRLDDAVIVAIVPFGLFVRLTPRLDGLIHISALEGEDPRSFQIGQQISVDVQEISEDLKRPGRLRVVLSLAKNAT